MARNPLSAPGQSGPQARRASARQVSAAIALYRTKLHEQLSSRTARMDMDPILEAFRAQSEEGLSTMEEALKGLEARPADDETLSVIFRICHTVKGDSSILGFSSLGEFAGALEALLKHLCDRTVPVSGEIVTLLLEAVDVLRQMLGAALEGRDDGKPTHAALLERIRHRAASASA